MFIICTNSWAPVGKAYGLPDWLVEDADTFTKLNNFHFDKVLLHEEHMVVHDAVHYLCNIPPTTKGEEDITQLEMTLSGDQWYDVGDWNYVNNYLKLLPDYKRQWLLDWYRTTNSIVLDHDLAEYLWEREAYLHR